jgi:hypothetical protein
VPPKVPKELLIRLSKQRAENSKLFEASLDPLVMLYFPIAVGNEEASMKAGREALIALIDGVSAKAADAVRDSKALEYSTALNEMNTVELFIKDKGKYQPVGTLFAWLGGRLIQVFEENMSPTIVQNKDEAGNITGYAFSVIAQRQRGRVAGNGGRFRPDITTLLDGTVVSGPATNILRMDQFKDSKAGKDWAMVQSGVAKGARSAIFLGLANDAQKLMGNDLPIFRVWVVNTDENGNIVLDANGMPTATEIDAAASQYVENLADNKAKFNNAALKDIREKVTQPKWNEEVLTAIRKEWSKQHPGQPVPGAPAIAAPVPVAAAPIAAPVPVQHAPVPLAVTQPVVSRQPVAARSTGGVARKRTPAAPGQPGGPVPVS